MDLYVQTIQDDINIEDNDEAEQPDGPQPQQQDETDVLCGYTREQLNAMSFEQIWAILVNCDEFRR